MRVKAAVNPLDLLIAHGDVKLVVPYRFPLTLGNEMAGVVEQVGAEVSDFKVGDRVFARLPIDRIGHLLSTLPSMLLLWLGSLITSQTWRLQWLRLRH